MSLPYEHLRLTYCEPSEPFTQNLQPSARQYSPDLKVRCWIPHRVLFTPIMLYHVVDAFAQLEHLSAQLFGMGVPGPHPGSPSGVQ